MFQDGINGVCMALADSVPGVSGGTVAFVLGFYDKFIGSIHDLAYESKDKKKIAMVYLVKLGIGWIIGMIAAVLVLSTVFESHIYIVSSIFIGFIFGAIPLIVKEEKNCIEENYHNIMFLILGILLVGGITYLNGSGGTSRLNLEVFSLGEGLKLFIIGMIAISAMFLPGISGSTLLLIFGAYMPVITAIKEILHFNLSYIPSMAFFGCGIVCGALTVVKVIKLCLDKFRSQTIYSILGMMIGSLYAIVMGPTTLDIPKSALGVSNFNIVACIIGLAIVLGLQKIKENRI